MSECLFTACECVHFDVVKYLVRELHVDVNAKNSYGETCLFTAVFHGHLNLVQWLVCEAKADVQAKRDDGVTCLHIACAWSCLPVVQFLVSECRLDPYARTSTGKSCFDRARTPISNHAAAPAVVEWLTTNCPKPGWCMRVACVPLLSLRYAPVPSGRIAR